MSPAVRTMIEYFAVVLVSGGINWIAGGNVDSWTTSIMLSLLVFIMIKLNERSDA